MLNTYLNIEEITNNRKINDLPTKESTEPKSKVEMSIDSQEIKGLVRTTQMRKTWDDAQVTLV